MNLTVTGGIRYEWLNSQVEGTSSPAGRFVPARSFQTIRTCRTGAIRHRACRRCTTSSAIPRRR